MLTSLVSFTLAAVLLVILPGPDTLVVLRGLVRGGRREGVLTSIGVLCGLMVWMLAAVAGLSALLQASELGYDALKIIGACYLVWMGVQSLRSVLRAAPAVAAADPAPTRPVSPMSRAGGFGSGLLTDLLNPKIGIVFISFLPGFVPHGYSVGWTTLTLGALYIVLTAIYCAILVAAAGKIATWMQIPRVRRRLDAIAGMTLIGFGGRLATES
ncbi:LysE family translocator [Nocardia rhamnosiphila]|uniref:LysE family translocator n=1 Tax=Nocardia rhamnosiphila TaxID=426716 RepID=A0ABV2WSZ3_9NOCA